MHILCFVIFSFQFLFLFSLFPFLRFCGYIFCKPSRDLTYPLGETKGFKGLVAYAKCNRDSNESELVAYFSFSFILLEDEQKVGVGVFDAPIIDLILPLIWPTFLIVFDVES